jgi:hypothetical protein
VLRDDVPVDHADFMREAIARVAAVALELPDAYEEDAWVGVRWRVRQRTFAHVAPVDGSSPAIDLAAGSPQAPSVVMTFRSSGDELDTLVRVGRPFFKPVWSPTVVGVHLTAGTDWDEIAELVTESYCLLAPKKLVALVHRPDDPA